jgi:hypothetical protein
MSGAPVIIRERVSRYRINWEGPVGEQRIDFRAREDAERVAVQLHNKGTAVLLERVIVQEAVEALAWLPGAERKASG